MVREVSLSVLFRFEPRNSRSESDVVTDDRESFEAFRSRLESRLLPVDLFSDGGADAPGWSMAADSPTACVVAFLPLRRTSVWAILLAGLNGAKWPPSSRKQEIK